METEDNDPVAFCIKALQSATNKEEALARAGEARQRWWVIDMSAQNPTQEQTIQALNIRSIVLATVATVYVWNGKYERAYELEPQFLPDKFLWKKDNQDVIDLYLLHLIISRQTEHLKQIFEDAGFRNKFLAYEDVYLSLQNPDYEFQSGSTKFITLVNRVNDYSRMLTGNKLM